MHRRAIKFNSSVNRNLFGPLHDEPASDFEIYLRFVHGVCHFMSYANREYSRSDLTTYSPHVGFPITQTNFFIPKRGKPALLTTQITNYGISIITRRAFETDKLHPEFKEALDRPIQSFEFKLESEYLIEEEHDRLTDIVVNGYNDVAWRAQLPKMLKNLKARKIIL